MRWPVRAARLLPAVRGRSLPGQGLRGGRLRCGVGDRCRRGHPGAARASSAGPRGVGVNARDLQRLGGPHARGEGARARLRGAVFLQSLRA